MRVIFMGPPGAGKGTQAQRLTRYLGVPHLSTGEMLRAAIAGRTAAGCSAEQYMRQGQLVPDPIILDLVADRLAQPDCRAGALFDGFPRTLGQARALDEYLAGHESQLDLVLELLVTDELVLSRLRQRQRADDDPQVIAERLRSYRTITRPLVDYYRQHGVYEAVDGAGTPDEVFERIRSVVERRRVAATEARRG